MRAHSYSRNGLHHGEAHHDGAGGVVVPVVRQPTDAVVAVSQDLDPQLVVFLKGRYVLVRQWIKIGHKSLARCPAVFLAATATVKLLETCDGWQLAQTSAGWMEASG